MGESMKRVKLEFFDYTYGDFYFGRYSNAIFVKRSNVCNFIDTTITPYCFKKGLLKYLLGDGKKAMLENINELLKQRSNTS